MTKYERITYRPENSGHVTHLIEIIRESKSFLHYCKVSKDCEYRDYEEKADGSRVEHEYIVSKSLITKRTPMVINDKYCELEPIK